MTGKFYYSLGIALFFWGTSPLLADQPAGVAPECGGIFAALGINRPIVEVLVEGSGDVVERFYLPALKALKEEKNASKEVLATFTDFSRPNDTPEQMEKRARIKQEIEDAGFTFIDKGNPDQLKAYKKMAPDYVVIATGPGMQRKLTEEWRGRGDTKGGLAPIRIFTEKPLESSVEAARAFRDSIGMNNDSVLAMDHYRPKLNLKPENVKEIETFLGGLKSFESYITEDRSGSDKYAALAKNNHRDGAIEQEGRENVLKQGLATDLVPHTLAMLEYFTTTSTLKPTEVKAGRYTGVDGDPSKPTSIPNETYFAAKVAVDDNHGNPVEGTIIVGKGLRVKKFGPRLEGNTKILELHGQNGNRIVFDLTNKGEGSATASYYDKDGKVTKTVPLEPLPYKALFGGIIDGKSRTNEMSFPLKIGTTFREKLAQLLKGARDTELPLYEGGMGGAHERTAPFVEDLWEKLPVLPDGEVMVVGGAGTMGKGFTHRLGDVAGLKVVVLDPGKNAQGVIDQMGKNSDIVLEKDFDAGLARMKKPRRVMIFAPNSKVSASILTKLLAKLEPGDVVVDGGNKDWVETEQWQKDFEKKGIHLIGMGVSGGEAGAWNGSSMMAGGRKEAWEKVKDMYEAIAGRVPDDKNPGGKTPSVTLVGPGGAGHFVKMTHNGIEYVEMELLAEVYNVLKSSAGVDNQEMQKLFSGWNETELKSFLLGATANVVNHTDEKTGKPLVEMIKPVAGQKGTGMWSSQNALNLGAYAPTFPEAVFARNATGKGEQFAPYQDLAGPSVPPFTPEKKAQFLSDLPKALYAARLLDFAQGIHLIDIASKEKFDGQINLGNLTNVWRTGSILQGHMLEEINSEFAAHPEYSSPLDSPKLRAKISEYQGALRNVTQVANEYGVPIPAFGSLLNYYDTVRAKKLPANLLQGMRDYFGGHTFERTDLPGIHHSEWGVPATERQ